MRLTSGGAFDISFSGDGRANGRLWQQLSDVGYGVAVDSQDRVVLAGDSGNSGATSL